MKRVTGLGGVFFKTKDPKMLGEWYKRHLHLPVTEFGAVFKWKDLGNPHVKATAITVWSPFEENTPYFSPSEKPFMFNYRVENLEGLLRVLREEGVPVVGEIQEVPYGKFGWIVDPEGNKIELWEPKDDGF